MTIDQAGRGESTPQTMIITGGTTGLGFETARVIAGTPNWTIVIASRNAGKAQAAVQALNTLGKRQCALSLPLDLASLASVRRFARDLAARTDLPPLRAIIASAGTQHVAYTARTQDGFEATLGVNHLAHFLLVNLLVPQLMPPARIVFVSSGTHFWSSDPGGSGPYDQDPEVLATPERFTPPASEDARRVGMRRYSTSKLANIYTTYELARRLAQEEPASGITVNTFDPGMLPGTGLARDHNAAIRMVWHTVLPLVARFASGMNTPATAGAALAALVLDPTLRQITGTYFAAGKDGRPHQQASSPLSYDTARAAKWWTVTEKLVQVHDDAAR